MTASFAQKKATETIGVDIDINTADQKALKSLPGIGKKSSVHSSNYTQNILPLYRWKSNRGYHNIIKKRIDIQEILPLYFHVKNNFLSRV